MGGRRQTPAAGRYVRGRPPGASDRRGPKERRSQADRADPQLQRRVDWLRGGTSAAAEAANGSIGATLADARRPEPLFVGLQEVGLAAGANGRLTVNGHLVSGMQRSADG